MYIQRNIEEKINSFIEDREIIAIIGPRQVGKTTTVNKCLSELKKKKINRISFEDRSILSLFEENIDAFIEINVVGYDILFIDEVQYSKNSGKNLKFIYDNYKIKIIITGSSAVELSLNSIKYLVGRIVVFEMQSLSFDEFLRYNNISLFNVINKKLFSQEIYNNLKIELKEYINYGGYPRIVIEKDKNKKKELLKNIYNTYLLKEVSEILQFKENRIIERLSKFLALQIGGIINYQDLCAKVGCTLYDIKNALYILEKTFIISFAENFHSNKQTELVKSPKVFFYDLGIRNQILNSFDDELIPGNIYEGFIASEMLKREIRLKYWRTKSGAEVDFVIEKGNKLKAIEVKTYLNNNSVEKSMRSFIETYPNSKPFIISLNYKDERIIDNNKVLFISYYEFLSDIL